MSNKTIALTAEGVALWVLVRGEALPEVVHWGAALPHSDSDVASAVLAIDTPLADGGMDKPVRVSVLPEARVGFLGRPGIEGQRDGRDWSPRWRTDSVTVDGVELGNAMMVAPARSPSPPMTMTPDWVSSWSWNSSRVAWYGRVRA